MKRITFIEVIVFLYVLLFVYAAVSKLFEYNLFIGQIGKSPLIMNYVHIIAWLIPALELIIAVCLLIPKTQLAALYAAFSLMLLFTGYILIILNLSPYVPCSCGGVLGTLGWTAHLVFNIAFVLLAAVGIYRWKPIESENEVQVSLNH